MKPRGHFWRQRFFFSDSRNIVRVASWNLKGHAVMIFEDKNLEKNVQFFFRTQGSPLCVKTHIWLLTHREGHLKHLRNAPCDRDHHPPNCCRFAHPAEAACNLRLRCTEAQRRGGCGCSSNSLPVTHAASEPRC